MLCGGRDEGIEPGEVLGPRTGSIVRQSTAIRVLPTPEDRISASSPPRSTVGARSGPSDMTPKNERGTAAAAGPQTVNAATAAKAASRARDREWLLGDRINERGRAVGRSR
jgi:hypothetical protein